jgi:hypothetical protein
VTHTVRRVAEYAHPAGDVHRAVTARPYWEGRVAELDGEGAELTGFDVDGETTTIIVSKPAPTGRMPASIAKLLPASVRLEVRETWGPFTDGVARGAMQADIIGMPITLSANLVLRGNDSRSTMDFDGHVDVRVPVLGKTIESSIATDVGNEMTAIAAFTTSWLTTSGQEQS